MNSARSGDVIVISDGREGYLMLDNAGESFRGWHGGPSVSESVVPLMFSMPGDAFVNEEGADIDIPVRFTDAVTNASVNLITDNTTKGGDGFLRNWHLSSILTSTLKAFNEMD